MLINQYLLSFFEKILFHVRFSNIWGLTTISELGIVWISFQNILTKRKRGGIGWEKKNYARACLFFRLAQ